MKEIVKQNKEKKQGRRGFLKKSVALAGLATVAGIETAESQTPKTGTIRRRQKDLEAYGERSQYVTSVREGSEHADPFGLMAHLYTPLQDLTGIITPASLHYVMAHKGFYQPEIDPEKHQLLIHGMVDRPLIFSMADLKRFPSVTRVHYLECNGNKARPEHKTVQRACGLTSCSEWTGVPLPLLLRQAGVQKGAAWIVAEGAEDNKGAISIPLAKAMMDTIVAYGQNGEPLRPQNGFPIRLLVPGFEGVVNVKWLRRIKVTDEMAMTYNEMGRYAGVHPKSVNPIPWEQGPKSAITFPSGGQKLRGPGHYQISGLAWSGGGAVRKVEISTDGGKSWKEAEIQSAVHRMAHTRFGMDWVWDGKDCVLMSRCTDELGQYQPTVAEFAKFWDDTIEQAYRHPFNGQANYILPWKVDQEGNVTNGLS